eukprot:COSAG01_NODE_40791_length_459_cov_2.686111_1_plen_34_part_01
MRAEHVLLSSFLLLPCWLNSLRMGQGQAVSLVDE